MSSECLFASIKWLRVFKGRGTYFNFRRTIIFTLKVSNAFTEALSDCVYQRALLIKQKLLIASFFNGKIYYRVVLLVGFILH